MVLAREKNPKLNAFLDCYKNWFDTTVVVLDAETMDQGDKFDVTYMSRALAGDFAAQRNAGNRAVHSDWVTHLDTDEQVSDAFCTDLPKFADAAQRDSLDVVGFPR